ncbi:hypothetical protein GEW_13401, partial [Pasteurella multocida subsp. gallicida str. Anand1_poultry]
MESLSILVIAITGFLYVNLSLTTRYKFKRSVDWSAYLYVAGWGVLFFLHRLVHHFIVELVLGGLE